MDLNKLNPHEFKIIRDTILFVFGLAGIAYETVVVHVDRPTLLVLFGACIGLPAFLHKDESQTHKINDADNKPVEDEKEVLQ